MTGHKLIFRLGHKAFSEKKYDEAVEQLTIAIDMAKDKPNDKYFTKRAEAYLRMDNYQECLNDCERAGKIVGRDSKLDSMKVKSLIGLGKLKEASEAIKQGLEAYPMGEDC